MEDKAKLIEDLLERVTEYAKTSYELVKLKTIDKTSDVVSTIMTHSIVFVIFATFMLFINLGLAFWLGEILGKIFYGFLVVGAFYGIVAIVLQLFMRKCLKKCFSNYFIRQLFK